MEHLKNIFTWRIHKGFKLKGKKIMVVFFGRILMDKSKHHDNEKRVLIKFWLVMNFFRVNTIIVCTSKRLPKIHTSICCYIWMTCWLLKGYIRDHETKATIYLKWRTWVQQKKFWEWIFKECEKRIFTYLNLGISWRSST